ncbi:hypothetical protein EYS42_16965, partial [Aquabacterium lacunae]
GQVISAADLAAGKLAYVPDANENGAPYGSFTFSVQDTSGAFDAAPNTFTLNVSNVNNAPVAAPDERSVSEDGSLDITAANGVIRSGDAATGKDSDADAGDQLSVSAISFTRADGSVVVGTVGQPIAGLYGTLTLKADGSYTYTPNAEAQKLDD